METLQNSFPVYVSGQYLTSENLNAAQNFLWQEERASRYLFNGNGIVKGLDVSFTDNTSLKQITVAAGYACTTDGYLIQLNDAITFDKGFGTDISWLSSKTDSTQEIMLKSDFDKTTPDPNLTETVLNAFEIFNTTSNLNDLPVGATTLDTFSLPSANYILFAWVFTKDAENDNCVQGDCNTKGVLRNYITRYFLVPGNQFLQHNTINTAIPLCKAARIKNLSQSGSTAGFFQASAAAWSLNVTELQPYFSADSSAKQLAVITNMLDASAQTAFANAVTQFTQIIQSVAGVNCPQYYNAFASDLSQAINELVEFYNDYAGKYPAYILSRIDSVIFLGGFSAAAIDSWRYYFIPAAQQEFYVFDTSRLKQLFMRAASLVNNFIIQANFKAQTNKINSVLVIPSVAGNDLLASRSIPCYYDVLTNDVNNEVLKNWNPHSSNPTNIFCYYDALIPLRNNNPNMVAKLDVADWTNENFFKIEGHLGMLKDDAIKVLGLKIINDGLPFQLLDCNVDYKASANWYQWYQDFSSYIANSLTALRQVPETKSYAYEPLKSIATKIQQTSYRQPDQVKNIVMNFVAYSNLFQTYKTSGSNLSLAKLKRANAAKNSSFKKGVQNDKAEAVAATSSFRLKDATLTSNVIQNYTSVIKQDDYNKWINGYYDVVKEVPDPQTKKLVALKDLTGLEYLGGGVPRCGTFVILHDGTNVIGDGCLSYFYRIDQGRIFDQ